MQRSIYKLSHRDGSAEYVHLLYHSPDNYYWMDAHDRFLNRTAKFADLSLYKRATKINKMIDEFLYKSQPTQEKMFYVEPINNVPFRSDRCFYVRGKYLNRINIISALCKKLLK